MKLAGGKWYRDTLKSLDNDERRVSELVINNPRIRTCMYPEEFVQYTNKLEDAIRDLHAELTGQGARLTTMKLVADIINDTNGGA